MQRLNETKLRKIPKTLGSTLDIKEILPVKYFYDASGMHASSVQKRLRILSVAPRQSTKLAVSCDLKRPIPQPSNLRE